MVNKELFDLGTACKTWILQAPSQPVHLFRREEYGKADSISFSK